MVLVLLDCDGDLNHVVTLTLEIRAEGKTIQGISGQLPPNPALVQAYEQWRSHLHTPAPPTEPNLLATLTHTFNQWLRTDSNQMIRDTLRATLNPHDRILVMVQTGDGVIPCLPWQQWDGWADCPQVAIAFRWPEGQDRPWQRRDRATVQPLRLLMVWGEAQDRPALPPIPAVERCDLTAPNSTELHQQLWDAQGWDWLCLSDGTGGDRSGPAQPQLALRDLSPGLKKAVKQGLVVLLLNLADGLAWVPKLAALGLPYAIVMREPMPDAVAQTFLHQVLQHFQQGQPLHLAIHTAQAHVHPIDPDHGEWLPMLYVLSGGGLGSELLTWDDLNPTAALPCPYRGLGVFRAADAAVFRGRQIMVERLAYAVYSQPLVALIGAAGTGKSSLVLAGLVPQFDPEAAIAIFRPGTTPLLNLAAAVTALLPQPDPHLALKLATGEANFLAVIKTALQHQQQPRLLLIADQFEELFTGCDRATQAEFLDIFLSPVHAADTAASPWHTPKLTVILTLRADFLEAALNDAQLAPLLCRHRPELLPPMDSDALHAAIVEPVQALGIGLEAGLTERILAAMGEEPGRLPWLEFALTRLWDYQRTQEPEGLRSHQLTHHAYDAIGGVEQAISRYAEQVYDQLNPAQQEETRRLFLQLVQPGHGTAATRRLISPAEVSDRALLAHWVDHQFIMVEPERVELVHEVLIQAWGRFQDWLLDDQGFRLWQARSQSQWQHWQQSGYTEAALLRGPALTEAEQWFRQRGAELAPKERDWIAASLAVRQRQQRQRRQRLLWWCASGLMLGLLWAGAMQWQRHQERRGEPQRTGRVCPVQPANLGN